MKRTTSITVAATLAALALATLLSGCGPAAAESAPAKPASLIGTWFDDATGTQYRFVSDHQVVVPRDLPGGGNALTYSRIADDQIDITYGSAHRVSTIDSLTADKLVLADPLSDQRQVLWSDAGRTTFASQLATTALDHASVAGSITAPPDITWVAEQPANADPDWTTWSVSSLDAYAVEWNWTDLKRAAGARIIATGGGPNLAFTFTLVRKVPTKAVLAEAHGKLSGEAANTSVEPTAGLRYIDVGYSASKTDYAAGTLVYLPGGGLVYSLGDGYAIPVGLDFKNSAFVPITHD